MNHRFDAYRYARGAFGLPRHEASCPSEYNDAETLHRFCKFAVTVARDGFDVAPPLPSGWNDWFHRFRYHTAGWRRQPLVLMSAITLHRFIREVEWANNPFGVFGIAPPSPLRQELRIDDHGGVELLGVRIRAYEELTPRETVRALYLMLDGSAYPWGELALARHNIPAITYLLHETERKVMGQAIYDCGPAALTNLDGERARYVAGVETARDLRDATYVHTWADSLTWAGLQVCVVQAEIHGGDGATTIHVPSIGLHGPEDAVTIHHLSGPLYREWPAVKPGAAGRLGPSCPRPTVAPWNLAIHPAHDRVSGRATPCYDAVIRPYAPGAQGVQPEPACADSPFLSAQAKEGRPGEFEAIPFPSIERATALARLYALERPELGPMRRLYFEGAPMASRHLLLWSSDHFDE